MASLALGLAGGYLFGPIGFMVGSAVGNLLFPQKVEGPRLSDLRLQGSSYGWMIPYIYGTMRISGQVIWQTDLVEHEHETGGKGGPEVTTFSYTASFAILLCNVEIAGVRRIWSDGTLIYDTTGESEADNGRVPMTLYKGTETQMPDPTMEADLGEGNVPAHRGNAYAVFADWDLGDFGNRIPNLSFEVFTSGGTIPWRVSTFEPFPNNNSLALHAAHMEGDTLIVGEYHSNFPILYTRTEYDIYGTLLNSPPSITTTLPDLPTGYAQASCYVTNRPILFGWHNPGLGELSTGWYYDGLLVTNVSTPGGLQYNPAGGDPSQAAYGASAFWQNDYLYAIAVRFGGASGVVARWPAPNGIPGGLADLVWDPGVNENPSNFQMSGTDYGHIFIHRNIGIVDTTDIVLWELTEDFEEVRSWRQENLPDEWLQAYQFVAYNGMLAVGTGPVNDWTVSVYEVIDIAEDDHTTVLPFIGSIPQGTAPSGAGAQIRLKGGLCVGVDGVYSLDPPVNKVTLASIVADLSNRAGLLPFESPANVDVSQLTDLVDGFFVTSRAEVRADIEPLRSAYFFDAVESAGVVRFVKRGGPIARIIEADDLAAHDFGSSIPPPIEPIHAQEVDLPAKINVGYFNIDAAWQPGSQEAKRQVTRSEAVADLNLPIAMDDRTARAIANTSLFSAWLERDRYTIRVPRKYALLEPTDIIAVGNYVVRIEDKKESPSGVIELSGPRSPGIVTRSDIAGMIFYGGGPTGNPTEGGDTTVALPVQPTTMLLFDLPLITDSDEEPGYYVAMRGTDANWRGAVLFKSSDSGSTYQEVTSVSTPSVFGTVAAALGNFYGGNVFDELNIITVIVEGGATLSSATEESVLAGANAALLGDELLQYKRATLVAASTYELSGLLRGRRGTEWAMGEHSTSEQFIALPITNPANNVSELGLERLYKAVTRGGTLAGAPVIAFTDNGEELRCYAPVHLGGGPLAVSDVFDGTVQLRWSVRARTGGAWRDFVDADQPDGLACAVQIWNSSYTLCARLIVVEGAQLTSYTAAEQVEDFGVTQQHVYFTVNQVGSYSLGRTARGVVPGLGASDDDPLVPIVPLEE